jgi:hypothetical protein
MRHLSTWVALAVALALAVPGTALAMFSRFSDEPMAIRSGGKSVLTEGPVDWASGEVRAAFFVVVRQGEVVATGVKLHGPPDAKWDVMARVRGTGRLVPGSAEGTGTAVAVRADGSIVTRVWSTTITLR